MGFYGGVNYGFGYTGNGYQGGRWENDVFSYNRAVNNLGSLGITNVYDRSVTADDNAVRVSFNGGHRGTAALHSAPGGAGRRGAYWGDRRAAETL